MSLTHQIATWTHGLRYEALPPEAIALAKRAMVDTIGCALAGWEEDCVRIVRQHYAGGTGVPLLAGGAQASPEVAALINGTAAHALDYDDVCLTVTTHPSAVQVMTALSAGYVGERSGRDLVTAYLLGVEISTRVGEAMGFVHYQSGWHATETLGTIGAAANAGYLLGLTVEQLEMAIGIAGSLAGGLRRNFGTMTKPLHAGLAAQNGVRAALLAKAGFTADADIFGKGGYLLAFSGLTTPPERLPLGEPHDVLASGLAVKKYPCCYATHRLIDGCIELHRRGVKPDDVEAAEIVGPPGAFAPLNHPRPTTGLEGKFSGQYTGAAALLDGRVGLASFTDAAVQRPAVQALLRRFTVREEGEVSSAVRGIEEGEIRVRATLRSGALAEAVVRFPSGSPQRPLSDQEQREKFGDCIGAAGGKPGAGDALFAATLDLERFGRLQDWWPMVAAATER